MRLSIAREPALQDDVRQFIAELNAYLRPLSPPEFQFQMTAEQMDQPDTYVFVVRNADGVAQGMGALRVHDGGLGELKRMYARPSARGAGIGRLIVEHLEDEARGLGLTQLKLETGTPEAMPDAHKLYQRCGYERCEAFLDYPASEYSCFYEKALTATAAA